MGWKKLFSMLGTLYFCTCASQLPSHTEASIPEYTSQNSRWQQANSFVNNNSYHTIRASMSEPLFLDFSSTIDRLNLVLVIFGTLWQVCNLVTNSIGFEIITEWGPPTQVTMHDEAEVSVVLPYWSPQNLSLCTYRFFIICASENAVFLA